MNSEDGYQIAKMMIEAANKSNDAANRMEEVLRQFKYIFEDGYGSKALQLLEEMQKINNPPSVNAMSEKFLKL
jgi:hypothetical protein